MPNDWNDLRKIMARLREPGGCPWDREQTLATLRTFLIEEAYEVIDASERGSVDDLKEELGDLLFQVFFQARIAEEKGWFTLDDVVDGIAEKMVERHPHVFGGERIETAGEVLEIWERRKNRKKKEGLWASVPPSLPALLKAFRLGDRAAQLGFDWENPAGVRMKIEEETREIEEAMADRDGNILEAEIGDLFFALAQWARHLGVNPENALQRSNRKFIDRMVWMQRKADENGVHLDTLTLDEMEALWQESKREVP